MERVAVDVEGLHRDPPLRLGRSVPSPTGAGVSSVRHRAERCPAANDDNKELTRLRLRPTRCISWRGWCKWTPVEPAGTCPGYRSSKLDGSGAPRTTGARDEHTAIGGGSLA